METARNADWQFSTEAGYLQNLPFGHRFCGKVCRCGVTLPDVQDQVSPLVCNENPYFSDLAQHKGLPMARGVAEAIAMREASRRSGGLPFTEWAWRVDDSISPAKPELTPS